MNGILIIDKPAGMTSHDVVSRIRRIFHQKRVGHTGTSIRMQPAYCPSVWAKQPA